MGRLEEELASLRAAGGASSGAAADSVADDLREALSNAEADAAATRAEAESLRARAQALEHELLEQARLALLCTPSLCAPVSVALTGPDEGVLQRCHALGCSWEHPCWYCLLLQANHRAHR